MKTWFRSTALAALLSLAVLGSAYAAATLQGVSTWWGAVPPPGPYFGQSWVNSANSTQAPTFEIFDGVTWQVVGNCTVGCSSTFTVASSTTTPPLGPGVGTIASATTTSVGAAGTSPIMLVTGTTTITGLGTPAVGVTDRVLVFTGSLTFTYGATAIDLPKAANITTVIGDVAHMHWTGAVWRLVTYQTSNIFN